MAENRKTCHTKLVSFFLQTVKGRFFVIKYKHLLLREVQRDFRGGVRVGMMPPHPRRTSASWFGRVHRVPHFQMRRLHPNRAKKSRGYKHSIKTCGSETYIFLEDIFTPGVVGEKVGEIEDEIVDDD